MIIFKVFICVYSFFDFFFFWVSLNNNLVMRFFMFVFFYLKYGEVNIMFYNFIVFGSIIFMIKEIFCVNIFCLIISEMFFLFK